MPSPRRVADARASRRLLLSAERRVDAAVLSAISEWLTALRFAILRDLGAVTAGAYPQGPYIVDQAAQRSWGTWRRELDRQVIPTVAVVFGEAFQQARMRDPLNSYRWQQQYLEEVSDRLRIWPEGAFEDIRPELMEALAEAESIDDIRDRIGRVLGIDAKTRKIRAVIHEVEQWLEDPELSAGERQVLRARRRKLWEAHDESLGEWQWKARRIARTEAHGAVLGGKLASAKARQALDPDVKLYKRWLATDDTRTRATHRVADGQVVPLGQKFRIGGFLLDHPADAITIAPHEVINCVVGSTRVAWPGQVMLNVTRRRYRGTFVHLVTANGDDLTVTPNHPVLTPSGYVPAGRLRPGDYVLATGAASSPHVGEVPPRIEDLYRAVRESGVTERVVARGVDFHGDVLEDDEVEVVWPERVLRYVPDADLAGDPGELGFVPVLGGSGDASGLSGSEGAAADVVDSAVTGISGHGAAAGGVSGSGEGPPFGGGHASHTQGVSLASGSDRETDLLESLGDGSPADSEDLRHLQDAHAIGVKPTQLVEVDVYTGCHDVFNLSTGKRWFLSNSILVHNCRCDCLIYDDDELQDELQGPDGSVGEVRPGGVRMGPDDPDDADAAVAAVAEGEGRALPALGRRGEDFGQDAPGEPEQVELTDEREMLPPPDREAIGHAGTDLTRLSDDQLLDEMQRANDTNNEALWEAADAEWVRRHPEA